MRLWIRSALLLWPFIMCSACISFRLAPETQRSKTIYYQPPSVPFIVMSSHSADKAWIDSQTGNIISFQSICNESIDPDIGTILQKSTSELIDKKILKESQQEYNGRKSERFLVSGELDGVTVHLDFLFFKKNACNYTLNFVALPEHFDKGIEVFNNFIEGFKVQ